MKRIFLSFPVTALVALFPLCVNALTVFDPANYSQNLLTAARNLQQINNQVSQLQNQAQMLINQAKNLQKLPSSISTDLQASLSEVSALLHRANGITYQISAIDDAYNRLYPQQYSTATTNAQILQDARDNWQQAREGYRHALHIQSSVIDQVQSDSQLLNRLLADSQNAAGALQATQAGNQLTALAAKQSMQLQQLLASSERAKALDRARDLATQEQARARFQSFLGDHAPYTR